jgi:hypothetical protein
MIFDSFDGRVEAPEVVIGHIDPVPSFCLPCYETMVFSDQNKKTGSEHNHIRIIFSLCQSEKPLARAEARPHFLMCRARRASVGLSELVHQVPGEGLLSHLQTVFMPCMLEISSRHPSLSIIQTEAE